MGNNEVVKKVLEIFNNDWNKQVVLYGPPGTSKTFSSTIIAAKLLGCDCDDSDIEAAQRHLEGENCKDRFKLVQFHPSYSYEDFVRGISVKDNGKGGVKYEAESKLIDQFAQKAGNDSDKKYVLIIDEINRAPLASVLGELIYGLEYRGKTISTPYTVKERKEGTDEEEEIPLIIPENLYIIGTMNTADRSIGSMDYAVRRRFAFVPVPSEPDIIADTWNIIGEKVKKLYEALMDENDGIFSPGLMADKEANVEDIKIGHTYFLGRKDKYIDEENERKYMQYRIDYQIKPIYEEYIKDGIIEKEGGEGRLNAILKEWKI